MNELVGPLTDHPLRRLCRSGACLALLGLLASPVSAEGVLKQFSEQEFFNEIPMVYSVSRLPQHPQDVAGSVTVIDRETIRRIGARDLSDVFRLVPGFQVGVSSGGRSVVAYHGMSGQVSQRMQVYIDGRSVYAPHLFGGVDWSSLSVPIDEIERIEIQRGSNSVTYGANAFLGVIHIVTRAAAQSIGFRAQLAQGSRGIADRHVRLGHHNDGLQWRMAAGRRGDEGLVGREDDYTIEYFDLRAEYQPSLNQEWSFLTGMTRGRLGIGYEGRVSDPVRTERSSSAFASAQYRHALDPGHEWKLLLTYTRDRGRDAFEVPLLNQNALLIDSRRKAERVDAEYQHFRDLNPTLRASWGLAFRRDSLVSKQYFNTAETQRNRAWRAYLNTEWRPSPSWTVNLGGLFERDDLSPTQFAPRLAVNWKPDRNHTFKLGYSSAFRTASLFEQRADWRIAYEGRTLDLRYVSTGGLQPERIRAVEFVYNGAIPARGLNFDVRLFHERLDRLITGELYRLPPETAPFPNATAYDLRNNARARNIGVEYQVQWQPDSATTLVWSHYMASPRLSRATVLSSVPRRSYALMLSRAWDHGWTTSATYTHADSMRWLGETERSGPQRLLTVRVARSLRVADTQARLAAVWRTPVGTADEFRPGQRLGRQFWLTLDIEY